MQAARATTYCWGQGMHESKVPGFIRFAGKHVHTSWPLAMLHIKRKVFVRQRQLPLEAGDLCFDLQESGVVAWV